jgi:hypothetical protein
MAQLHRRHVRVTSFVFSKSGSYTGNHPTTTTTTTTTFSRSIITVTISRKIRRATMAKVTKPNRLVTIFPSGTSKCIYTGGHTSNTTTSGTFLVMAIECRPAVGHRNADFLCFFFWLPISMGLLGLLVLSGNDCI